MAPSPVQKASITQALLQFDNELRRTSAWYQWEADEQYRFAIIHDGQRYPAKKILSLAAPNSEQKLTKSNSTNGFLRSAGFDLQCLHTPTKPEFIRHEVYDRITEINDSFGGNRQSGISLSRKSAAIFLFSGLAGEQHGYHDIADEDGTWYYTGEGQKGKMEWTSGNIAIRDHAKLGKALHLFRSLGKRKGQEYLGEYVCAGFQPGKSSDSHGVNRETIIFILKPVETTLKYELADEPLFDEAQSLDLIKLRHNAIEAIDLSTALKTKEIRTIYSRSKDVKRYVLARSKGICESCELPAPFKSKIGLPYLEPHHIDRVSDGGLDHPKFVGAICPSCHKEIHYGEHGDLKNEKLRAIIQSKEYELELQSKHSNIS